ncbi:S-adenosyl-L-methionine-dependent methyltransferase [Cucurbitaria berberidis CBS 394.84]|uniref:S-adenosyl-L-methionine-dependent methyltransferase n=1 Tax=Cucurbitaria berberidis CBS 394.84 TaxID=1168544 RepID=A0A9P4GCI2_9PLEO|nr:S-adenosyl-L-methionine-dependent methyltransferase [Cucurbitaria berberidis CBS 394.84]KAF1842831.1 S-adenosyl-L-methionine-dependent methyltransferase [Cucurbitaria berberidis CBS 394.84]
MASSDPHKPFDAIGMQPSGQDSAVHLQDAAESSQPWQPAPISHQQTAQDPEYTTLDEDDDEDAAQDLVSDSGFDSGSLLGDETDTLASSILNHRMENGRQYHAYRDGAYWGPNDELAKEILDFAHHMYLLTLDQKLFLAPIQDPQTILDCGTGTGIWAIDMADQYPSATVIGTDLSPIQPEWVPPNCLFEIDDVSLDWTFPPNHFDFIHIRELFGCIPDWDFFFQQAFEHTKPGGYIEIVEHSVQPVSDDDSMGPDHFYHTWGKVVIEMGKKFGKSFTIWEESAERIRRAGFVDVVVVDYKWPMNGWPTESKQKNIGRWNQLRLMDGVEGFMLRLLTQVGGWSIARAQLHLAQMRKELKSYRTHAYLPGTVVYARKPLSA